MLERIMLGDNILIDFIDKCVFIDNQPAPVQPKKQEWILLNGLIERNHAVYSYKEIAYDVWGDLAWEDQEQRPIKQKVFHLNNQVFMQRIIESKRSAGYLIDSRVTIKNVPASPDVPIEDYLPNGRIVSLDVSPVSMKNYVSRPNIEKAISNSLSKNKITIIRGLSGLGKSELVRKVSTSETGVTTRVYLELNSDGSGEFEKVLDSQVRIADVPEGKNPLACKKCLLDTAGSDYLVIVDNFNNIDNIFFLDSLVNSTGAAKVLITSQIPTEKVESLLQIRRVSGVCFDLEAAQYQQEHFAPMVFCSYADLAYNGLNEEELMAVHSICDYVSAHTMLVSVLGLRLKKLSIQPKAMLIDMAQGVERCMHSVRVKLQKDLKDTRSLTAYETLKELSATVLQRKYTERERQVLGATILSLVSHTHCNYKNVTDLPTLVGDSVETQCFEAGDALESLCDDGILKIQEDGRIELHPLYQKLFSDPDVSVFSQSGVCMPGPVAELSIGFVRHLISNSFVSVDYEHVFNIYGELQYLLPELLFSEKRISCGDIPDYGWLSAAVGKWYEGYSVKEIAQIQAAINENHAFLADGRTMTDSEAKNIFYMDVKKGFSRPQNPSAFFVIEHEKGRSLWLYDTVEQKEWCVINLQNQCDPSNRYYCQNQSHHYEGSKCKHAILVQFLMEITPQALVVPQSINNTLVTTIAPGCAYRANTEFVQLPASITRISSRAFRAANQLRHVVILGNSCVIEPLAFSSCDILEYVMLAKECTYIGTGAFEDCEKLGEAYLPAMATMDAFFPSMESLELELESPISSQTDVYFQEDIMNSWKPMIKFLDKFPQLTLSAEVCLPVPKGYKLHNKKAENGALVPTKEEILAVFSHIKWCFTRANVAFTKGNYSSAKDYLMSLIYLLINRGEYFSLNNYSTVLMQLGIQFANCQIYDAAYVCISIVSIERIKDKGLFCFYHGFILGRLGAHKKAIPLKQKSLEYSMECVKTASEDLQKTANLNLASDYNSIAESYIALKEYDKAHDYLKRCLEIRKRYLEPNDIYFALVYENFGDLYVAVEQEETLKAAQRFYMGTLAIYSAQFGSQHKNTIRIQDKLLALNMKLEQLNN